MTPYREVILFGVKLPRNAPQADQRNAHSLIREVTFPSSSKRIPRAAQRYFFADCTTRTGPKSPDGNKGESAR